METEVCKETSPLSSSQTSLGSAGSNHNHDETSSMPSSKSYEEECISRIFQVLKLCDSCESKIIARRLMINGIQNCGDVLEQQTETDKKKLLDILKIYVKQYWDKKISEEWFHKFLQQQALEKSTIYDQIVTRTATYGSSYMKDDTLLSLTIQFLCEFDEETMKKGDVFNQIWNTLINEGRQGIQCYKNEILGELLKEQLENEQSPLYLALRGYFHQPLENLFKDKEVNIVKDDILEIALDCVANHGWWLGLHHDKVTKSINSTEPGKFETLIEKLKEYLTRQGLPIPIPNQSSSGQSSVPSSNTADLTDAKSLSITSPIPIPNQSSSGQSTVPSSNTADLTDAKSLSITSPTTKTITTGKSDTFRPGHL
ncbi:unnamed protein product [Rotaria sp. Silwood1]|nr:unnamed protein product [Rotaria sp. Silwood1]